MTDSPVWDPGAAPRITSPCTNVCRLDWDGVICLGCGRTVEEIANWLDYTDDERRRATEAAANRLAGRGTNPA